MKNYLILFLNLIFITSTCSFLKTSFVFPTILKTDFNVKIINLKPVLIKITGTIQILNNNFISLPTKGSTVFIKTKNGVDIGYLILLNDTEKMISNVSIIGIIENITNLNENLSLKLNLFWNEFTFPFNKSLMTV